MRRHRYATGVLALFVAACGSTASPTPVPAGSGATGGATGAPATPAPSVAGGQWGPAGDLNVARGIPHAVLLTDGRVLAIGDDNACGNVDTTPAMAGETWDSGSGAWTLLGALNKVRSGFVLAPLPGGSALVAGGTTSVFDAEGFLAFSSTKVMDPGAGTWSSSGLLSVARDAPAGAVLADGHVLVAGGRYHDATRARNLASTEVYDAGTKTWSDTGTMAASRYLAQAVTLSDGRVLVVGGLDGKGTALASADVFDPATRSWSRTGALATARERFGLVALADGGALVFGGVAPEASGGAAGGASPGTGLPLVDAAERWNPGTGAWSTAGTMPSPAAYPGAARLADGRVLVAGGLGQEPGSILASARLFDPGSGAWTEAASLPSPRANPAIVALPDGSALVIGGYGPAEGAGATACGIPLKTTLRFVPGG